MSPPSVTIDVQGSGPLNVEGLVLEPDATTVIFGPNGAGKTTLIRRLAGIRGDGLLLDVSYLQQRPYMFRGTAGENLGLGMDAERAAWAGQLADRLGVGHLLENDAHTLSGGERHRLALARSLAVPAAWYLLDEPLAAIDLADRNAVVAVLAAELRDRSAVLVTHDIDVVATMADRLVILDGGRLVEQGEVAQVIGSPTGIRTAEILGVANLIEGTAHRTNGVTLISQNNVSIVGMGDVEGPARALFGAETITLRSPDEIPKGSARNNWTGRVETLLHRGQSVEVAIDIGVRLVAVVTPGALADLELHPGSKVGVSVKANAVRIVPA